MPKNAIGIITLRNSILNLEYTIDEIIFLLCMKNLEK